MIITNDNENNENKNERIILSNMIIDPLLRWNVSILGKILFKSTCYFSHVTFNSNFVKLISFLSSNIWQTDEETFICFQLGACFVLL